MTLVEILVFVLTLGLLVLAHEFGHFILAKRAGVKVEEFAIGFPPRLLSFRRGETDYSLNAIPLGGYVKMLGEEDPSDPRSFAAASRRWRLAILLAGVTMNVIAAILLFTGAFATGWPEPTQTATIVTEVMPGTPAATAGLRPGDEITSMGGQTIVRAEQLRTISLRSLGKPIPLVVSRDGQEVRLTVTPRTTWPSDQGPIGIQVEEQVVKEEPVYYALPAAFVRGIAETFQTLLLTVSVPVLVIRGLIPADVARPVGPVGIYQVTAQAAKETITTGWWNPILTNAGLISAGLALVNLLPIPGLDGGRMLFVIVEAIRGRRVNPQRESMIHFIGLAFLISLVLVVTYFDVQSPVSISFSPH